LKEGLDYFSLDTDFFQDKKVRLVKSEFGAKGVMVLLALLCEIYGGNGYFKKWDDEDCFLMADAVGCGCSHGNISQVVHGCLRRSLFDDRVFKMFGVLTSAGIQRRYIRAVALREEIPLIQEYWLLNLDDKKDVPASIRNKIVFKNISKYENPDKKYENPVNMPDNLQSKVKERKIYDDNGQLTRACAKGNADGGNCGKSVENGEEETRQEAARIAERLFRHYFGREATGHDVDMLWEEVARYETQPDGMFTPRIIPEKTKLVEYAFKAASESGVCRWDYVRQILSNLAARRLRTRDECEIYDAQREFDKDNRR